MPDATLQIIVNAIITVVTVVGGVATAYFALRSKMIDLQTAATLQNKHDLEIQNAKLDVVTKDVQKIELATNSMKDALVAAKLVEGEAIGKAKAEALHATKEVERVAKDETKIANNAIQTIKDEKQAMLDQMQVKHIEVDTMTVEKTETKAKPKP